MMRMEIGPERTRRTRSGAWTGILTAWLCALAITSCLRNEAPDSPNLPGSKDYAGDDWTHDGDGDGIADSVEKYVPGCGLSPLACLQNARKLKDIPTDQLGLRAEDLLLWQGDRAKSPELSWTPSDASLRGYALSSSDTDVVSIRGGGLYPKGAGESRITVLSPGFPTLTAQFLARVVGGGIRLDSVRASDLVLTQNADTVPALAWYPPDASYKDYSLSVEPDSVAVAIGDTLRGVKPGTAKVVVVASDGRRRAEFALSVVPAAPAPDPVLSAKPLYLVVGDPPAAPDLSWDPPQAAGTGYRLSIIDTTGVVGLTPDSQKVQPLLPGKANVHVASPDGRARADFQVTVSARRIAVAGLAADDMVLHLKDGPQAPRLHWQPENPTDQGYDLATRDSAIAVPFEGKIKPLAPGEAMFLATSHDGGFAAEFRVTVQSDSVPHPRPDSVTGVSVAPLSLLVGEKAAPAIAWVPAGVAAPAYSLASDDTAVAMVAPSDSGARILGRRAGATRIVLTAAGGLTAVFPVTLTDPVVALVAIQAPDFSLDLLDGPYVPMVSFTPSDATDKSYTLSAPLAGGAIGIEANKVVPLRPGKAPLRIVPDGNPSAAVVCSVTVTARVRSVSAPNDTLLPGSALKSAAERLTWVPPEATDKSFRLSTKDTGVVRIDPAGTSYQSVGTGSAHVIVQALDGSGAADTFTVLVRIPVTRIIAKDVVLSLTDSIVNPWFLISFEPANASTKAWSFLYADPGASPTPSSVVAIVGNWQLQAVGLGKADLIAYSLDNHAIRDTFTVTVGIPVKSLSIDPAGIPDLFLGGPDLVPPITVEPAEASVRTWQLSSANPSIAAVIGGNSIHPVKAGSTVITAVSDGNPQATVTFVVRVRFGP